MSRSSSVVVSILINVITFMAMTTTTTKMMMVVVVVMMKGWANLRSFAGHNCPLLSDLVSLLASEMVRGRINWEREEVGLIDVVGQSVVKSYEFGMQDLEYCAVVSIKVVTIDVTIIWGRYHGGRRPSSDDSFHSPTVIPPSALDKPSIMTRHHRRRTTR